MKLHLYKAAKLGSKYLAYALMAICPILLCAEPASAQLRFNRRIDVKVLDPATVQNEEPMDFGTIIPGTTESIIRINQDNGRTALIRGDASVVGGAPQAATFNITGEPNENVRVTLSQNSINLVRVGGTEMMRINRFRISGGRDKTLDASGAARFSVGGQIRIDANQAGGVYQGSFALTVNYF